MTDRHDAAVSGPHTGVRSMPWGPGAVVVDVTRASSPGRTSPSQAKEMTVETVKLATKRSFTSDEARAIANQLGIDFGALGCDLEQFRMGLGVELEHGPRDPETDVSGNDPIVTGKIALAHLTEFPDYYTRLAVLEREAADHKSRKE
jgi:hypothetical protein